MDFVYLLVFLLFSHLAFRKKDAFFVFRSLGLFLSISIVYYYIYRLWGTVPSITNPLHKWYVVSPEVPDLILFFLILSGIIILVRFFKNRSFAFLVPRKSDFKFKELLIVAALFILPWAVSWVHFNYNFGTPNYTSIDAPLHFSKFRKTLEHTYNSNDVAGATFSAYVLTHLFFPNPNATDKALTDFQLANVFIFSLIALYFLCIAYRSFKIKPPFLALLAYVLVVFGYFFNLMIMGFVSQLYGLFLLLFFLDVFPRYSKKWYGIFLLLVVAEAQLQTYSYYWLAVMAIFVGLVVIKKILALPKGKWYLLAATPPVLAAMAFIYLKTSAIKNMLAMANSEGEMYKIVTGNFLVFLPLIVAGMYLAFKKWRVDHSEFSTMFFASLVFSLLSTVAYFAGFFSTYTFTKSFYLSGPFLLFFSVYPLAWLWEKYNNKFIKGAALLWTFAIFTIIAIPIVKKDKDPNDTFQKLVSSENDKNVWNPTQQPLDIFRYNSLVFRNKSNRIENFISFDSDKLEFIKGLKPHLPEQYQSYYAYYDPISIEKENRITIVADFKTSYWVFSLTKIWNRATDNMAEHNEQIVNYDGWLGHYQEPYIIILDTQSTNRWLWLNENKFKWDDYTVEYQVGKNYLLKLKKKRFPKPV